MTADTGPATLPSIDTLAFWMLLDRYRESPTAQRTAVGNYLIAYIDSHVSQVVAKETAALVEDVDKLAQENMLLLGQD